MLEFMLIHTTGLRRRYRAWCFAPNIVAKFVVRDTKKNSSSHTSFPIGIHFDPNYKLLLPFAMNWSTRLTFQLVPSYHSKKMVGFMILGNLWRSRSHFSVMRTLLSILPIHQFPLPLFLFSSPFYLLNFHQYFYIEDQTQWNCWWTDVRCSGGHGSLTKWPNRAQIPLCQILEGKKWMIIDCR